MLKSGLFLFMTGIIVALVSAAKLPSSSDTWSDQIIIYAIAITLALIGLGFLRSTLAKSDSYTSSKLNDCLCMELLQGLLNEMQKLKPDINQLDQVVILRHVSVWLNRYIIPFTAKQTEIFQNLGQPQGIEILMTVARGERLLNRVCSAIYDDHDHELYTTYLKALAAFEEADALFHKHQTIKLFHQVNPTLPKKYYGILPPRHANK